MKKVLRRNMMIVFSVYTIVGMFGYITFADQVDNLIEKGNILLNDYHNHIPIVVVYYLIL